MNGQDGRKSNSKAFYIVGVLLIIWGLLIRWFFPTFLDGSVGKIVSGTLTVMIVTLGLLVFILPAFLRYRYGSLYQLPDLLKSLETEVAEIENIQKTLYKLRRNFQSLPDDLTRHAEFSQKLTDIQTGYQEHLSELRQDVTRLKTENERWAYRLGEYVNRIHEIANTDEIDEQTASLYERVFDNLCRWFEPLGFRVIRPMPGDPFDDEVHAGVDVVKSDECDSGSVAIVHRLGVGYGSKVVSKAEVSVAKESEKNPPSED